MIRLSTTRTKRIEVTILIGDNESELDAAAAAMGLTGKYSMYGCPVYLLRGPEREIAIKNGYQEATAQEIADAKAAFA